MIRVLLVEDDPLDARLVRRSLAHEQHEHPVDCAVVGSLADAFDHLVATRVDVVLLDLTLPDSRGEATVRRLHERHPRVPTIVLTGLDDAQVATRALGEGAMDYLVKGEFGPAMLNRVIHGALERQRLLDEQHRHVRGRAAVIELGQAALEGVAVRDLLARCARWLQHEYGGVAGAFVREDGQLANVDPLSEGPPRLTEGDGSFAGSVVLAGVPRVVHDLQAHLPACADLIDRGFQSAVGVPVRIQHGAVGVVVVAVRELGALPDDIVDVIGALAHVVSAAARRDELEVEARERAKELAALFAVGHDIKRELRLDELCGRVAGHLAGGIQHAADVRVTVEVDGRIFRAGAPDAVGGAATRSPIVVADQQRGQVTLEYREGLSFLPAETRLVDNVAASLGGWLERQEAQRRRREVEHRLALMLDTTPTGIVFLDGDGRIAYGNPAAATLLGFERDPETGEVSSPPRNRVEPALGGFDLRFPLPRPELVTGAITDVEVCVTDPTGAARSLTANLAPLDVGDGEPGGSVVTLQDVTEQRAARQRVERSEERFRLMAELADDVVYRLRVTEPAHFEYLGPAVARLTGFSPDEFYADAGLYADRCTPAGRAAVLDLSRLQAGSNDTVLMRWSRADGRDVWLEDRRTPVFEDGELVAVQGIVRDVSARHEQEEALKRALEREQRSAEELRRVNEMKNTFLQAVSHELRTPLTSVLGYARTLQHHGSRLDEARCHDFFERLVGNAQRLERLLSDLLDVDRLTRGATTLRAVTTDLADLTRRSIEALDLVGTEVTVDAPAPVEVPVDPPKVERIVENLVANAVKHTPAGTRVWVRVQPVDGGALLSVEDEGDGIDPELADRIFEPFQQGATAAESANPGTGIGLALVAQFTGLHGGRAWVEAGPRGGARFCVWLPERTPRSVPVGVGGHEPIEPEVVVREAIGQFLSASGRTEVGDALHRAVHLLGGQLVPAQDAGDALPIDVSLGDGPAMLVLPLDDRARERLRRFVPRLVEDARTALERLGRRSVLGRLQDRNVS